MKCRFGGFSGFVTAPGMAQRYIFTLFSVADMEAQVFSGATHADNSGWEWPAIRSRANAMVQSTTAQPLLHQMAMCLRPSALENVSRRSYSCREGRRTFRQLVSHKVFIDDYGIHCANSPSSIYSSTVMSDSIVSLDSVICIDRSTTHASCVASLATSGRAT